MCLRVLQGEAWEIIVLDIIRVAPVIAVSVYNRRTAAVIAGRLVVLKNFPHGFLFRVAQREL